MRPSLSIKSTVVDVHRDFKTETDIVKCWGFPFHNLAPHLRSQFLAGAYVGYLIAAVIEQHPRKGLQQLCQTWIICMVLKNTI